MSIRIVIKRVYDPSTKDDGLRVLVDRVWPRGKKKEQLHLDAWWKELAPSTGLRKWFGHDPAKWAAFRQRYQAELEEKQADIEAALQPLLSDRPKTITLLYAARDTEHNQAIVLRDFLPKFLKKH